MVNASETFFTGMPEGKEAEDVVRLRIVTLKVGSARRAERMGDPTEPDAKKIRTFLMAMVDGYVTADKTACDV